MRMRRYALERADMQGRLREGTHDLSPSRSLLSTVARSGASFAKTRLPEVQCKTNIHVLLFWILISSRPMTDAEWCTSSPRTRARMRAPTPLTFWPR